MTRLNLHQNRLKPGQGIAQHGGRGSKHDKALHDIGLTDDKGRLTVFDANDKFEEDKFLGLIRDYRRTHTHQQTATAFKNFAGDRGERVLMPLSEADSGTKLERFSDVVHTAPTSVDIQKYLMEGPLNQFEQMLANIANIGNTLLTPTLDGLNASFKTINASLIGFNEFLQEHQGLAKAGGYGLLAAGGLAVAKVVGWGVGKASSRHCHVNLCRSAGRPVRTVRVDHATCRTNVSCCQILKASVRIAR